MYIVSITPNKKETVMKTFFDYDHIECVTLEEAKNAHPNLPWQKIEARFSWGMGDRQEVPVMTLADLNFCIKTDGDFEEYNYFEVEHCSVCRRVLLPDDECYGDEKTGDALCEEHAVFNESTDMYRKKIF
jgi:hypothetical protein